jgi:hypothetical protein
MGLFRKFKLAAKIIIQARAESVLSPGILI